MVMRPRFPRKESLCGRRVETWSRAVEFYFLGKSFCLKNQPVLGTESQNILEVGTYSAIPPVGVVGTNT